MKKIIDFFALSDLKANFSQLVGGSSSITYRNIYGDHNSSTFFNHLLDYTVGQASDIKEGHFKWGEFSKFGGSMLCFRLLYDSCGKESSFKNQLELSKVDLEAAFDKYTEYAKGKFGEGFSVLADTLELLNIAAITQFFSEKTGETIGDHFYSSATGFAEDFFKMKYAPPFSEAKFPDGVEEGFVKSLMGEFSWHPVNIRMLPGYVNEFVGKIREGNYPEFLLPIIPDEIKLVELEKSTGTFVTGLMEYSKKAKNILTEKEFEYNGHKVPGIQVITEILSGIEVNKFDYSGDGRKLKVLQEKLPRFSNGYSAEDTSAGMKSNELAEIAKYLEGFARSEFYLYRNSIEDDPRYSLQSFLLLSASTQVKKIAGQKQEVEKTASKERTGFENQSKFEDALRDVECLYIAGKKEFGHIRNLQGYTDSDGSYDQYRNSLYEAKRTVSNALFSDGSNIPLEEEIKEARNFLNNIVVNARLNLIVIAGEESQGILERYKQLRDWKEATAEAINNSCRPKIEAFEKKLFPELDRLSKAPETEIIQVGASQGKFESITRIVQSDKPIDQEKLAVSFTEEAQKRYKKEDGFRFEVSVAAGDEGKSEVTIKYTAPDNFVATDIEGYLSRTLASSLKNIGIQNARITLPDTQSKKNGIVGG